MVNVAFVYVMQAGDYIKIGVTTTSIIKRAKQVQTGCPIPIEEIFFFPMESSSEAYLCEKLLHQEFCNYKSHGEWFYCFRRYTSKIEKVIGRKSDKFIFNKFTFFNKDMSIEFRLKIKDADDEESLISISVNLHNCDDVNFKRYTKESLSNMINRKLKNKIEENMRERNFEDISHKEHIDYYKKTNDKKRNERLQKISSNPLLRNIVDTLLNEGADS